MQIFVKFEERTLAFAVSPETHVRVLTELVYDRTGKSLLHNIARANRLRLLFVFAEPVSSVRLCAQPLWLRFLSHPFPPTLRPPGIAPVFRVF